MPHQEDKPNVLLQYNLEVCPGGRAGWLLRQGQVLLPEQPRTEEGLSNVPLQGARPHATLRAYSRQRRRSEDCSSMLQSSVQIMRNSTQIKVTQ